MILSLQKLMSDTQAQSRLVVVRPGLVGEGRTWHRGYRLGMFPVSALRPCPILGGTVGFLAKPIGRMPSRPLFAARSASSDTSVIAKQEGSP